MQTILTHIISMIHSKKHPKKECTRFRKCMPAEIKLAAALHYLRGASD